MASDKNFFQNLPKWALGIVAVTVTAGVSFAAWKTYQYFQKKSEDSTQKAVGDQASGVVTSLKGKGQALSFPKANYEAAANTIKVLLDGCQRVVSEEQVVEEIVKVVKKPIDWYYLVSVFGNRDVADCGTFGVGHTNYDLISLLKDQLESTIIGDVVNGKRYWDDKTLVPLTEYLSKIGVSI